MITVLKYDDLGYVQFTITSSYSNCGMKLMHNIFFGLYPPNAVVGSPEMPQIPTKEVLPRTQKLFKVFYADINLLHEKGIRGNLRRTGYFPKDGEWNLSQTFCECPSQLQASQIKYIKSCHESSIEYRLSILTHTGKLILTDRLNTQSVNDYKTALQRGIWAHSTSIFCHSIGLPTSGNIVQNPNGGNYIQVWEWNLRPKSPTKVTPLNIFD